MARDSLHGVRGARYGRTELARRRRAAARAEALAGTLAGAAAVNRTSLSYFIVWLMMRRQVTWFALLTLAALLAVALAACSFGGSKTSVSTTPESTTTSTTPSQRAFVRTCQASVSGTIDDPAWRKHSVFAGPLVFYSADQYAEQPASLFAPIDGNDRYAGQKLLVLLRRGAVATVDVPESERSHAALLYNPDAWNDANAYRIQDGESAVTFKACKKRQTAPVGGRPLTAMTQFNGGFVVAGARCLPLDVRVRGEDQIIPVKVKLSFGAGDCP